jgi:flagellar export protein FliJ
MAKRFEFELEPVLEMRKRLERQKQLAVAELQAQRLALEERIRAAQQSLADGRRYVRELLTPGGMAGTGDGMAAVARVRLSAHMALHTTVHVQRLAIELSGVVQRQNAARAELLRAAVARKAVEALRARRWAAWLAEQKRLETAAIDEINTQRAMMPAGDMP